MADIGGLLGVGIALVVLITLAMVSIEFGDKQMSVLDRWKGVRHQWAKDHHGID